MSFTTISCSDVPTVDVPCRLFLRSLFNFTGTTTSYVQNDDNEDEGPSGIRDTISGSGEGFNTLAGYLFGNNTAERAMSMTTPVNIDVSPQTRYSIKQCHIVP